MVLMILLYNIFAQFSSIQPDYPLNPIVSNNSQKHIRYNLLKQDFLIKSIPSDTTKTKELAIVPGKYYVIAGSFLIPKNADNQVLKLKNLGFKKCYKYNFPETEFYAVVVDTFKQPSEYINLTETLRNNKVDYFIKNF